MGSLELFRCVQAHLSSEALMKTGLYTKEQYVQFLERMYDQKQTKNFGNFLNIVLEILLSKECSIGGLLRQCKSQIYLLVQGNDNFDYLLMNKIFQNLRTYLNSIGQSFKIVLAWYPTSLAKGLDV